MPLANYTNGFEEGVLIRDVLGMDFVSGNVFYVGNNSTTLLPGERGASNGNKGTYLSPFSTIDYAIGRCAANRNDVIIVRSTYTETITSAAAIACDVAGVAIIGMSVGGNRPTITFSDSTAGTIAITANNVKIKNLILVGNIDALVSPITIAASGFDIDVEYRDTSSTVEAARCILGTAAADKGKIKLKYVGFPAGDACVNAIRLVGSDNVEINVNFYGKASTAVVEFLTTACTNVNVSGYFYVSGTTNFSKNVVDTVTGSTWFVSGFDGAAGGAFSGGSGAAVAGDDTSGIYTALGTNGTTVTDSATTVLGAIGADNANNAFASTSVAANADGSVLERLEYIQTAVATDSAVNWVGVDNANNTAATTSVVANLDGSVLERLEALMDPLGGYDPILGFRVTKTSNMADGAGTDNLFTVTGRCLITHLSGEVTTVIGTTTTMKIRDVTNSNDLCAATTITTDAVGTMYSLTSITANILNGTGATPVIGSVPNITGALPMPMAIVGDVQAPLTIAHVLDGAGTGAVAWVLYYKPLTATSSIVAAA